MNYFYKNDEVCKFEVAFLNPIFLVGFFCVGHKINNDEGEDDDAGK